MLPCIYKKYHEDYIGDGGIKGDNKLMGFFHIRKIPKMLVDGLTANNMHEVDIETQKFQFAILGGCRSEPW